MGKIRIGVRRAVTIALVVGVVGSAGNEIPAGTRPVERPVVTLSPAPGTVAGGAAATIVGADVRRLASADRVVLAGLPLPDGRRVDLRLVAFRLVAPDTRFVVVDAEGSRNVRPPRRRFFRGDVVGIPGGRVRLSVHDDRLTGRLSTDDGEYVLESSPSRTGIDAPPVVVVSQATTDALPTVCDGHAAGTVPTRLPLRIPEGSRSGVDRGIDDEPLVAPIAIDSTFEWFQRLGSTENAQTYILDVMADVSVFLADQIDVRIEVAFLRVFTAEPDPYTDGSLDTSVLLTELQTEWNLNLTNVERAAVHLFSYRNFGAAGRAFIDRLCDNQLFPGDSEDYGVTLLPVIGSPFEAFLVAHELGHNFGSPHTQCYDPPIDTCATETGCYDGPTTAVVGTLMSNCSQFDPTFHPRVKDEKLRPGAEAAFGLCLESADPPGAIGPTGVPAVRAEPVAAQPGDRRLAWGPPCNEADVPGQDFAVYAGTLGQFGLVAPATCTTGGQRSWPIPDGPADRYYLVVPTTEVAEGSYGRTAAGVERPRAASPCRPVQQVDACDP